MKNIFKTNGIFGFYQGYNSHLIRNMFAGSIHLGTYDLIRENIAKYKNINIKDLSMYNNIFAGSVSGCLFWSVIFPLDVIKSKMQSDNIDKKKRIHKNYFNCINNIYKTGNIKSFYKGLVPCMFRAMPANGLMLYTVTIFNEKILCI